MKENNCCFENNSTCNENTSCCGDNVTQTASDHPVNNTNVTQVSSTLSAKDIWGAFKVRLGIGRGNYAITPGVYAVGSPNNKAPVLVSANYKLTFDTLRKNLAGLDCWILILDTKGVNVWCAAGKGTFGTSELISRIEQTGLSNMVTHRKLILPQLGAPGVSAHEVKQQTGFSVIYGPVRARDIKEFIISGLKATKEMRKVRFTIRDRFVLIPIELIAMIKKSMLVFGILFLINLFAVRPFGVYDVFIYIGAVLVGTVFVPILLPLIPGRAFSWKGWILGVIWTATAIWLFDWYAPGIWPLAAGYLLLLPSLSAYAALNFTGCTPYTSSSGVLKEMRMVLPLIIGSAAIGVILVLIQTFFVGVP